MKRFTTTPEVYCAIHDAHKDKLKLFSSFTDMTGSFPDGYHGTAKIMTEWGLPGADFPLMGYEKTYPCDPEGKQTGQDQYTFWLCVAKEGV